MLRVESCELSIMVSNRSDLIVRNKVFNSFAPASSIDFVFSVFLSNFFKLYKISLRKNRFVTLFFIRFHKIFKRSR